MTSQQLSVTSQEGPDGEPTTPLTPGFDALCFTADQESNFFPDDSDPEDLNSSRRESYHYEPGVIRKMKKSGRYALNSDVFDSKSRPVSVASMHEIDLEDNPAIVIDEDTDKEERFDNVHKPVLFLKSCPSPATFLHKKLPPPSPTSLMGKLSLLDSIISDINETRIQDNNCVMCGVDHHATELCLHNSDGFTNSDTEIHCNPAFSGAKEQKVEVKKGSGKRKKKKRRKVLKFDHSDDSSDTPG